MRIVERMSKSKEKACLLKIVGESIFQTVLFYFVLFLCNLSRKFSVVISSYFQLLDSINIEFGIDSQFSLINQGFVKLKNTIYFPSLLWLFLSHVFWPSLFTYVILFCKWKTKNEQFKWKGHAIHFMYLVYWLLRMCWWCLCSY